MPGRFVILEHNHPHLHWDFLLEIGAQAATWRLVECPRPGITVVAERIADHRLFYLDYEGPVSENRGTVRRVCSGMWTGALTGETTRIELTGNCEFHHAVLDAASSPATWSFT